VAAADLGFADTIVNSFIDLLTRPPGCWITSAGNLKMNNALESTASAIGGQAVICGLCSMSRNFGIDLAAEYDATESLTSSSDWWIYVLIATAVIIIVVIMIVVVVIMKQRHAANNAKKMLDDKIDPGMSQPLAEIQYQCNSIQITHTLSSSDGETDNETDNDEDDKGDTFPQVAPQTKQLVEEIVTAIDAI
jgi:hypothetical protein